MSHTAALLLCSPLAATAAPQLYETGPARDVALVRFVNADAQTLTVTSANGASLSLSPAAPIGDYQPARADAPMNGAWRDGTQRSAIGLTLRAGALASSVAWRAADGGLRSTSFVEAGVPFDGLHASLAFYTVAGCEQAGLTAVPGQRAVFDKQGPGSVARRAVNPVRLTVQARCDGRAVGAPLDLGQLQAGQRYSVFLIPGRDGATLIGGRDGIAH
ncbi:cell division protein FtsQ [Chitinasiproducens palmae]|uniref:cell division protein FtsQ n=1 Tax=Chitinasiproducens palmae TaxID=1770053 RepID=UPI0011137E5F|nr:cell division protein FtsQ [Chitinasiproducens palmae]